MSDAYDWSPYLEKGEEVLWQGRPDGRSRLYLQIWDTALRPCGLLCLALGSLGVLGALGEVLSHLLRDVTRPAEGTLAVLVLFALGYLLVMPRPRTVVADAEQQKVVAVAAIKPETHFSLPLGMQKTVSGGYAQRGINYRFLPDWREMADSLRRLKAQATEATP